MNQAWQYHRYGDETALELHEIPMPIPRKNEILVQLAAASVNPVDWKILAGQQKLFTGRELKHPRIFGSDFAGTVIEVGNAERAARAGVGLGSRVFGMLNPLIIGSFQKFLAVKLQDCAIVPPNLPIHQAAGLAACGATLWQVLKPSVNYSWRGKKVLVSAASGGVGHLLLQYLAGQGTEIIASASRKRFDLLSQWGATICLDYSEEDSILATAPWDCLIDCHGGFLGRKLGGLLKNAGRYIPVSIPNPQIPKTVAKAIGLYLSHQVRTRFVLARPSQKIFREVALMAGAGQFQVHVENTFSLAQAPLAVKKSISGHVAGKIIVDFLIE